MKNQESKTKNSTSQRPGQSGCDDVGLGPVELLPFMPSEVVVLPGLKIVPRGQRQAHKQAEEGQQELSKA